MRPPQFLDGAKVIEWAWSGDNPFGHLLDANGVSTCAIHGQAICAYAGDNRIYRFSCDRSGNVEHDSDHGSVDEARYAAAQLYQIPISHWRTYD